MRTRFLQRMTHKEVVNYCKQNDLIFVAVGTVEVHGNYPVNVETVAPEAFAYLMAEKTNGLVLGDLPYFFPGASPISPATVQMSIEDGVKYLKRIAYSLFNQGFRRQVYVSLHGPAFLTVGTMIIDFFDETKVPISFIDMDTAMMYVADKYGIKPASYDYAMSGAYEVLNMKEQLVVDPEVDASEKNGSDTAIDRFEYFHRYAHPSGSVGFYFVEPQDHAGWTGAYKTVQERDEYCKLGADYMHMVIDHMDMPAYVEALREIDDETGNVVIKKYGDMLPYNQFPYKPRRNK